MNVKIQELKRIRKIDNKPIEVKVEDIMITGIAVHSITSKFLDANKR